MKKKVIFAIPCILVLCLFIYLVSANNARTSQSDLSSGGESTHTWRAYGTVTAVNPEDKTITAQVDPDKCYKIPYNEVVLDCSQPTETFASSADSSIRTGDAIAFEYFTWKIKDNSIVVSYAVKELKASGTVISKDSANKLLTVQTAGDAPEAIRNRQLTLHYSSENINIASISTGDSITFSYYEDTISDNKDIVPQEIE